MCLFIFLSQFRNIVRRVNKALVNHFLGFVTSRLKEHQKSVYFVIKSSGKSLIHFFHRKVFFLTYVCVLYKSMDFYVDRLRS